MQFYDLLCDYHSFGVTSDQREIKRIVENNNRRAGKRSLKKKSCQNYRDKIDYDFYKADNEVNIFSEISIIIL